MNSAIVLFSILLVPWLFILGKKYFQDNIELLQGISLGLVTLLFGLSIYLERSWILFNSSGTLLIFLLFISLIWLAMLFKIPFKLRDNRQLVKIQFLILFTSLFFIGGAHYYTILLLLIISLGPYVFRPLNKFDEISFILDLFLLLIFILHTGFTLNFLEWFFYFFVSIRILFLVYTVWVGQVEQIELLVRSLFILWPVSNIISLYEIRFANLWPVYGAFLFSTILLWKGSWKKDVVLRRNIQWLSFYLIILSWFFCGMSLYSYIWLWVVLIYFLYNYVLGDVLIIENRLIARQVVAYLMLFIISVVPGSPIFFTLLDFLRSDSGWFSLHVGIVFLWIILITNFSLRLVEEDLQQSSEISQINFFRLLLVVFSLIILVWILIDRYSFYQWLNNNWQLSTTLSDDVKSFKWGILFIPFASLGTIVWFYSKPRAKFYLPFLERQIIVYRLESCSWPRIDSLDRLLRFFTILLFTPWMVAQVIYGLLLRGVYMIWFLLSILSVDMKRSGIEVQILVILLLFCLTIFVV